MYSTNITTRYEDGIFVFVGNIATESGIKITTIQKLIKDNLNSILDVFDDRPDPSESSLKGCKFIRKEPKTRAQWFKSILTQEQAMLLLAFMESSDKADLFRHNLIQEFIGYERYIMNEEEID